MNKYKPITTRQFLFLWLLALPATALFVSCILLWFGPKEAITEAVCYLLPERKAYYLNVRIVARCKGPGDWIHGNMELIGNKGVYAELDFRSMKVLTVAPISTGLSLAKPGSTITVTGPRPLTDVEVLDWFDQAGEDVTDPRVIAESVELATILGTIRSHGLANLTPTHFEYTDRAQPIFIPAPWLMMTLVVFWCIVWVSGFVYYFYIRKKWFGHTLVLQEGSGP